MAKTDDAMWQRISAFVFDEESAAFPFSVRLARENGWTDAFAARAIAEYRRFAYLCCISPEPMTPSVAVDEVWHLHLVYTRSYWQDFCGKALGKPLHHGPTKGGGAEGRKFHAWYERTLLLYEREFGAAPPRDIWPAAEIRFDVSRQPRKVDPSTAWVVPKPRGNLLRPVPLAALAFTTIALAGCSLLMTDEGDVNIVAVIVMVFVAYLAFRLIASAGVSKGGKDGGGCGGGASCGGESGCGGGGGCGGD